MLAAPKRWLAARPMGWNVHKFGGTSVADASCVRRVAAIVAKEPDNLGVVVSAMKGVTDDLLGLVDRAARREPVDAQLRALRERHERSAIELLGTAGAKPVLAQFEREIEDIQSILKALSLVRSASHRSRDLISGFGEVWSARQIAAFFKAEFAKTRDGARDVVFVDAREVLVIDKGEMG